MPKLSLSKAWDETRSHFPRDGKVYAAVALALYVLPATIFGTLFPGALMGTAPPDGATSLLMLAVIVLSLVGQIAMVALALRPIAVREAIGHGLRRAPAALAAFIIFLLPVILALAPFLPAIVQAPNNPPPGALLAATLVMLTAFILGVRLALLLVPVAAAERIGPIALLKRSWALSSGNWWRLAVFLVVYYAASYISARAIGFVVGGILIFLSGPLQPASLGALALAAALGAVGAIFTTIFSLMLAGIYAQLAAPSATVPEVSRQPE